MTSLALLPDIAAPTPEPIELLIADDDSNLRAVVASRAALAREGLVVHEAEDGGEAIQVALQRRPQFALLELNMPGLDGVEVALVLRELLPGMRLALYSADPSAHCDTAREFCLPLFDKVESDAALRWLMKQDVRTRSLHASARTPYRGIALECSACTYGIAASLPPERCPMCHREGAWTHPARAAFRRRSRIRVAEATA